MKHFRKVSAVLLAMLMVAVILPSTGLLNVDTQAAEVGAITNGDFEEGDLTGWTYNSYGYEIYEKSGCSDSKVRNGSYSVRIGNHSSVQGTTMEQIVPVNTNATCTLTFYLMYSSKTTAPTVKVYLGNTSSTCTYEAYSKTASIGSSFTSNTHTFSTGSYKYAMIQFVIPSGASNDSYMDDVSMTCTGGNTGTHAKPALKAFTTEKNRPNSDSNNVIIQPGFEATTNAQWNTSAFLTNGVSHVTGDAAGAHSGSGYLKYYRGSVAPGTWSQFAVDLPSAGEYVFSAWVRTPELSANNKGVASIGILDEDTGKFLTYGTNDDYYGHYSTPEIQIRSTATDNDWHLRAVTFYVGGASTIHIAMYGLSSEMYVDDISIHLLTNGVTYSGDQKGALSVSSTSVTNKYCESEDNLIVDCNMNGSTAVDFWSQSSGWNNGFLEFNTDAQDTSHGTVLHYKGANPGSDKLYRYVKFIYVEPNTSYTVSFDYRVVSAGNRLMFIDNNIEKNAVFHTPSLGSASNSWSTYAFTFNTGNYNRIGIVFQDHASAEAYFDDFRFFKTSDGIADEPAEEIFPTLKHNDPANGTSSNPENKVLESRMEMGEGNLGLAFLFNLEATGVTRDDKFIGNYTNGKVQAFEDGVDYTLVKAGAVVTNKDEIGQDEKAFKLDNVQTDKTVIDVNAKYLFYNPNYETSPGYDPALGYDPAIYYAIRITNIPESAISKTIYVRPYYVFDYNGEQVTVYGDIVYDCYEEIPDINDGWLEWD